MKNLNLIIFFIFLLLITKESLAKIQIKYKIDNEIVTNIDILDEKKYLVFLRPSLKGLSNDELLKIAENSLIREIIKKKELTKIFKEEENFKVIEEIKKSLFKFKNVENEKQFEKLASENNINYEKIIDKMKYEAMWNEFIFQKYSSFIKVDRKKLRKDLLNKIASDKKFEYNLSEILFEIDQTTELDNKYTNILNYITMNDFKIAAAKFSISNSANKGGEIGWLRETVLSDNLIKVLEKMEINEITKPMKYPNGYLILRINNKREMEQNIDVDNELINLVNFEKNRQLNQFSLLFYKKLKQNTKINEY